MRIETRSVLQTFAPIVGASPNPPHSTADRLWLGIPCPVNDGTVLALACQASSPAPVCQGIRFCLRLVRQRFPCAIDMPWRDVLPCARRSSRCPSRDNREGGANPPRWRHCKRGTGPKPTVGTPMGRAWLNPPVSQETCQDDQVTTLRSREVPRRPGTRPVLRVMPLAE